MSRTGLCLGISVSVLFASVVGGSADSPISAGPLTPEGYSPYSAIYRSVARSGELLGIAASPLSFPHDPTCLRPSTLEEREMVEAAMKQVVGRLEWKREFNFGGEYILIPSNEVNKAIDCIQFSNKGLPAGCEPYAKLHYVRFVSIPIFNREHTRALVATSRSCGGLCGKGGVFVCRKTTHGWELEKDSFAQCHWVS